MGLFTGLLTLPLTPVRGVVWVAEQIADEVDRRLYDEAAIRRELFELELAHDEGEIDDEDRARREDELFERLIEARARREALDAGDVIDGEEFDG
jgi:Gas vesicle protein G